MIEALVRYIEKHGLKVDVRPGYLVIWQWVGKETIDYHWSIAQMDLRNRDLSDFLFCRADVIISQIIEEIVARETPF
jgi:hypothetical protein